MAGRALMPRITIPPRSRAPSKTLETPKPVSSRLSTSCAQSGPGVACVGRGAEA